MNKFCVALLLLVIVTFTQVEGQCNLKVGEEYVPVDEDYWVQRIVETSVFVTNRTYYGTPQYKRDAHPKSHGCVNAYLTIDNDVSPDLAHGIFAQRGKTFQAIIRYSNGSPTPKEDSAGDSRGMAVKVLNVPGDKIIPQCGGVGNSQDFISANRPAFFLHGAKVYSEFMEAVRKGGLALIKWLVGGFRYKEAIAAFKFAFTKIGNPLYVTYFSVTPYKLGPQQAVKFQFVPVRCVSGIDVEDDQPVDKKNPDYLRARMVESLKQDDRCFEMRIQKQVNPCVQLVEDSMIEWEESDTRFRRVAFLKIPKQIFSTSSIDEQCENLSFAPWHSLPEHRPLGEVNRVRRKVYEKIASYRHEMNKVKCHEPTNFLN